MIMEQKPKVTGLPQFLRARWELIDKLEARWEFTAPEVGMMEILPALGATLEDVQVLALRLAERGLVVLGIGPDLDVGLNPVFNVSQEEGRTLLAVCLDGDP